MPALRQNNTEDPDRAVEPPLRLAAVTRRPGGSATRGTILDGGAGPTQAQHAEKRPGSASPASTGRRMKLALRAPAWAGSRPRGAACVGRGRRARATPASPPPAAIASRRAGAWCRESGEIVRHGVATHCRHAAWPSLTSRLTTSSRARKGAARAAVDHEAELAASRRRGVGSPAEFEGASLEEPAGRRRRGLRGRDRVCSRLAFSSPSVTIAKRTLPGRAPSGIAPAARRSR